MHKNLKDLTGHTFGRLIVLYRDNSPKFRGKHAHWVCQCNCTEETIVSVNGRSLRDGTTQSCGCYKIERVIETNTKHGMEGTPTYKSWDSMKRRCLNPNAPDYSRYGGRGHNSL